jgi:Stealth-like protein
VTEADFLTMAGLAKVRLSPGRYVHPGEPEPVASPDRATYNAASLLRRDFGLTLGPQPERIPLLLRTSVLAEIDNRYAEHIARTRAAQLPTTTDVATATLLAPYYGLATARAVEWPSVPGDYVSVDIERGDAWERLDDVLTRRPRFFSFAAAQADVMRTPQAEQLHDFLMAAFPCPAPWERSSPVAGPTEADGS